MWPAAAPALPAQWRAAPGPPQVWQAQPPDAAATWPPAWGAGTGMATHPLPAARPADNPDFSPGDSGFIALCRAYRDSGGLARQPDAAHCLAGRGQGDAVSLAALVAAGHVFTLPWHGQAWLPMFQLDAHDHARRVGAHQALAELHPVLDGWGMAAWLARGNDWLAGQRPFDLLTTRLPAVLAAARADRFVARG